MKRIIIDKCYENEKNNWGEKTKDSEFGKDKRLFQLLTYYIMLKVKEENDLNYSAN